MNQDKVLIFLFFEEKGFNSIYIKLLERYKAVNIPDNVDSNEIIFGYHGNARHFIESMEYIFPALNLLSRDFKVTLKVVSNIEQIKKIPECNFNIKLYEYSYPEIYEYLSDIDIGLVPNQISCKNKFFETYFI